MTPEIEAALVALLLATVFLPQLGALPSRRAIVAAVALVGAGLGVGHFVVPRLRAPPVEPIDRPLVVERERFAGSSSCRSCHPGAYSSWHDSYHRTMTQEATPATRSLPDFGGRSFFVNGVESAIYRKGDTLYFETAASGVKFTAPIVLTTGSHHVQNYWFPTRMSRTLDMVPVAWLIDDQRWAPRNATFLRPPALRLDPPSELGRWNATCLGCHTTDPRPNVRTYSKGIALVSETRVGELGISCEACHGPGEAHVRANRDPRRRYGLHVEREHDSTIVNPARLSAKRAAQVCGRCHSVNLQREHGDWIMTDHGDPFVPGDDLAASRVVVRREMEPDFRVNAIMSVRPRYFDENFFGDGTIRVAGRDLNGLTESRCYRSGELTCITCHSMHETADDRRPAREWADRQLRPSALGDAVCARCHEQIARDARAHTHHELGSSGAACMNCHMPHTTFGVLKASRSHRIDSPRLGKGVDPRRPNACNLCHLDRTLAWTAERLSSWYGQPMPALDDDQREVAAGLLWMLKGDAGERALALWSAQWEPARAASGTSWMLPAVASLLADPYDGVRLQSCRALKSLPRAECAAFDFLGPDDKQAALTKDVIDCWEKSGGAGPVRDARALLLDASGKLDRARFDRLRSQRNDAIVDIAE